MGIASVLSIAAHLGAFGPMAQAFSALIALVTAFVAAPLIAWATKGGTTSRGEPACGRRAADTGRCERLDALRASASATTRATTWRTARPTAAPICSLCCTLDARCHDLCKPRRAAGGAVERAAALAAAARVLAVPGHRPRALPAADGGGGAGAAAVRLLYQQSCAARPAAALGWRCKLLRQGLAAAAGRGIVAWWLVLAHKSRQVAQEESQPPDAA